ncbi:hypothetical protein ACKFKG_24210 [Phormidesmis sp. 146-35]
MPSDRLIHFQERLERLYEQLEGLETTLDVARDEDKPALRQKIKLKKKNDIQPVQQEYWSLLRTEVATLTPQEPDAQAVIDVVAEEVTQIESNPSVYPDELLQQIRAIRDKLDQPGTSAALKIKPVISLLPPGIGLAIEGELDTENFLRKIFPPFTRLVKGAKK